MIRERLEQKEMAYLQARDQVLTQRRLKNNTRFKMIEAQEKKAEEANRVR